jgi:hypothetical protein
LAQQRNVTLDFLAEVFLFAQLAAMFLIVFCPLDLQV